MGRTSRARRFEPRNESPRLRRLSRPHRVREQPNRLLRNPARHNRQPRCVRVLNRNARLRPPLLRRNPRARLKLLRRNARWRLRLRRRNTRPPVLPLRGGSLPTAPLLECKPRLCPRPLKRKPHRSVQPWRRDPRSVKPVQRKRYLRVRLLSHSTRHQRLTHRLPRPLPSRSLPRLSQTPLRPRRRRSRDAVPPSPCRLHPTTRASRLRATRPPCPRA